MATTIKRGRGRPTRQDETPLDRKVLAAKLMLLDRMKVEELKSLFGICHRTLYAWVRAACSSDHEIAPALRRLAQARGLWRPRS